MPTETPVYIAHLRPGQRVRWQSRTTTDAGRLVLLDMPASLIKPVAGHAKKYWMIQVDGESEPRRARIGELSDDFTIPSAIPECLPNPWRSENGYSVGTETAI